MVKGFRDQSGFTMVETIAGLAILLILVAIISVFFGPAMLGLPQFTENNRQKAEVAQLQALLIQISQKVKIPYWWPESVIELSETTLRIHDISKQNTSHEIESPDILDLDYKDKVLRVSWERQVYSFDFDETVKFSPWLNEQKQLSGISLSFADGLNLLLPFASLPLPMASP